MRGDDVLAGLVQREKERGRIRSARYRHQHSFTSQRGEDHFGSQGDDAPTRLNHVLLYVEDVSRSLDFYEGRLGFKRVEVGLPDYARVLAPDGDATIGLHLVSRQPTPPCSTHSVPRIGGNSSKSCLDNGFQHTVPVGAANDTSHGGAGWTRTTDNAIMSRALYHLSYGTADRQVTGPAAPPVL